MCTARLRYHSLSGRGGFTLLEMMIVLVLMSLITGLVLPRLDKIYSGLFASFSGSEVLRSIAGIGYRAMAEGKPFTLLRNSVETSEKTVEDSPKPSSFVVPSGWRVVAEKPIQYRANGICIGGIVHVFHGEDEQHYRLSPPYCVPVKMEEEINE